MTNNVKRVEAIEEKLKLSQRETVFVFMGLDAKVEKNGKSYTREEIREMYPECMIIVADPRTRDWELERLELEAKRRKNNIQDDKK